MFRVYSAIYARKAPSSTRCFSVIPRAMHRTRNDNAYPPNPPQSSYFSTLTGYVKSYNRKNAYGFIFADESEGITRNVFVHRNQIAGVTDDTPFGLPYLKAGDRVQFEIRHHDNGKCMAENVKHEDGSLFPVYRGAKAMETFLKSRLGVSVYDILDDSSMSEEDKVTNIIEEFEKARSQLNELQATNQAQEEAASAETENMEDGAVDVSKTDEPLETSTTMTEAPDKEEPRSVY